VNAKKAKKLRKRAKKITGGFIPTSYINQPGDIIKLDPNCTRAVYKKLKINSRKP